MAQETDHSTELRHGVIGTVPLAFLVIAAAAPLGACAANIPLIIGLGNGIAAPMDFLFIGVLLILFAVGYTAMSSHVTNAGAFYTYISMGLGKRLGGAAGYLAVAAYNFLTLYTAAVGGYFGSDILNLELGIQVPWWIITIVLYLAVFLLGYFGIEGGTKFLMVCLVCEASILVVTDVSVLIQAGPDAYTLESFDPGVFFSGAPGLGIAFAFLCFIGFEATAIFGEEAKDPRKTVPRATFFAVIFVGVVYALTAWSVIAAMGGDEIVAMAQSDQAGNIFYTVVTTYLGPIAGHIFNFFFIMSAFACWLATHNMASRYLYAFGRAGMLPKALGRTHPKHKSPYIASIVQLVFGLAVVLICLVLGFDPYTQIGAIASAIAVVGIMTLELLVCASVIGYMRKHNSEEGYHYSIFTTTIAPLLALVGLCYIAFLVISNFALLTGLDNMVLNIVFACLMWIIGICGFIASVVKDKRGTLADPTTIEVDE